MNRRAELVVCATFELLDLVDTDESRQHREKIGDALSAEPLDESMLRDLCYEAVASCLLPAGVDTHLFAVAHLSRDAFSEDAWQWTWNTLRKLAEASVHRNELGAKQRAAKVWCAAYGLAVGRLTEAEFDRFTDEAPQQASQWVRERMPKARSPLEDYVRNLVSCDVYDSVCAGDESRLHFLADAVQQYVEDSDPYTLYAALLGISRRAAKAQLYMLNYAGVDTHLKIDDLDYGPVEQWRPAMPDDTVDGRFEEFWAGEWRRVHADYHGRMSSEHPHPLRVHGRIGGLSQYDFVDYDDFLAVARAEGSMTTSKSHCSVCGGSPSSFTHIPGNPPVCSSCWNGKTRLERVALGWEADPYRGDDQ